jgi:predicted nucleic acid-binding Zn ribbon protein
MSHPAHKNKDCPVIGCMTCLENYKWKKMNEKRKCDWCGEMKKVQQLKDTHYLVCIDCALSGF